MVEEKLNTALTKIDTIFEKDIESGIYKMRDLLNENIPKINDIQQKIKKSKTLDENDVDKLNEVLALIDDSVFSDTIDLLKTANATNSINSSTIFSLLEAEEEFRDALILTRELLAKEIGKLQEQQE